MQAKEVQTILNNSVEHLHAKEFQPFTLNLVLLAELELRSYVNTNNRVKHATNDFVTTSRQVCRKNIALLTNLVDLKFEINIWTLELASCEICQRNEKKATVND